ncbi:unnamed protein product [Nippostrongylus brasiliensis]|uniref:Saposin B-type domain-containing protein n=1 Tax=Nippostrongylus brasiliensis TaxID=27835 RepID=A0A0N4YWQ2_NIPBR|nr:unnamed protein product [Nippostrongylus brasiliensis]
MDAQKGPSENTANSADPCPFFHHRCQPRLKIRVALLPLLCTSRTPAHIETALHPVYAFFEGAKSVQTPTGNVLLSCLECKIAAQDAINFLISNRNKQAASVQQFACHELLPSNFTAGCDDFLSLYLPTVLYMTWEQFTPEGVCTKAKSCNSVSREYIALQFNLACSRN